MHSLVRSIAAFIAPWLLWRVLQANKLQWTLHGPVVLLREPADYFDDTVAQIGCRGDGPSVSSVHLFLPSASMDSRQFDVFDEVRALFEIGKMEEQNLHLGLSSTCSY